MKESGARKGPGEDDRALVKRAQEGDREAFEILVLKYQERIFRLIRRLLSDPEQVEDLAQEVFVRAYNSLGGFKQEASFYTWLYKIALNSCRNYYRKMGRRPEGSAVDDERALVNMQALDASPEQEAFRSEFWATVRSALRQLPDEQREAIVLCDLEGLSYDEMANVIGIPVGTVRSRVFRGRRSLQLQLAPYLGRSRMEKREERH